MKRAICLIGSILLPPAAVAVGAAFATSLLWLIGAVVIRFNRTPEEIATASLGDYAFQGVMGIWFLATGGCVVIAWVIAADWAYGKCRGEK